MKVGHMDIHCKIAAVISIVTSALGLLMLAVMALFLTGAAAVSGLHGGILMGIAAAGSVFFGMFALLMVAELVAAICYLRGAQSARIWLIVFNAFSMLNFPIGTLLGGYCVWALARRQPGAIVVLDKQAP
jgi:hypothetical protein